MTLRTRIVVEIVIAATVCGGAAIWGTRVWNAWVEHGGQPSFYQSYFEPSVMIACGRGFVVAGTQPPALSDFLAQRRDSFSCSDLPAGLEVGERNLFQRPWMYLMYLVGFAWRVLGISWSGMAPLFGVLFGISVMLVYGICRLGMSTPLALAAALGVSTSTMHLVNLPHLRDFAKEPLTLALFFLIGLLVIVPPRRRYIWPLAGVYGLVLGVAYGFRTDFLIDVPLLIITIGFFIRGGAFGNLRLKASALAVFLAALVATGWPVLKAVYENGGCQWHAALLGLQAPFDASLAVTPAPYDFGYAYADEYVYSAVSAFATRQSPGRPSIPYCSPGYDAKSSEYLRALAAVFPADFLIRAYASMRLLAEAPFLRRSPPVPNWKTSLFAARGELLRPFEGAGLWIVALALIVAAAGNLRTGLFLWVFAVYVGGYPSLQFHERHYFHLEFATWWALGFLVQRLATAVAGAVRAAHVPWQSVLIFGGRAAVLAACGALLLVVPLRVLRAYQTVRVKRLLSSYIAVPKKPLGAAPAPPPKFDGDLVEIDLSTDRCDAPVQVKFAYNPAFPASNFTRIVTLAPVVGTTRVFLAVFDHFTGWSVPERVERCVTAAYRLADSHALPLLIDAVLTPSWEAAPLHQALAPLRLP